MPAPLDKSHPEVVKEIRRLAKLDKSITQIKVAIKDKFDYDMIGRTIKDWADVDFGTRSGTPLTKKQIDDIVRLKSVDKPPTDLEVAKKLNISANSVRNHKPGGTKEYFTPEKWAEKYPDMSDKLLSEDKKVSQQAFNAANKRRQREVAAAAKQNQKVVTPGAVPLTEEEIHKKAQTKAHRTVKNHKLRSKLYRISKREGPKSFISHFEYRDLEKSGAKVPKILGTVYQGDFSSESMAAMRKIVYDDVYEYLRLGGDPDNIPLDFGHILALKGINPETGERFVSGLTNRFNVEMQDSALNQKQSNKISKELLRGLRYHAPGFMGLVLAGFAAPWGEAKADPWIKFAAEATTGLDVDRAITDPSRLRSGRIGATIAEDTIVPLGQMIAGGLSSENIPQEPYYGMGRQRGLLDIGHPGIGEEKQKRRTNIWT